MSPLLPLVGLLLISPPPRATPPEAPTRMEPRPSKPALGGAAVSPEQIKRFSRALRGLMLTAMPSPLYEKRTGDDRTASTVNGMKWDGLKPKLQYAEKNDGPRRHMKLTGENLEKNLQVDMKNLKLHEAGRTTFDLLIGMPLRMDFTEERWSKGVRLYDATARARVQAWMTLHCESTMRTVADGFLPTIVYRLRVVDSDFLYTDLVFEHVAGLGGEAAKLLGDTAHSALTQWKPSVERKLRERLETQIVKAADTKEIRLGLGGISRGKTEAKKQNEEPKKDGNAEPSAKD